MAQRQLPEEFKEFLQYLIKIEQNKLEGHFCMRKRNTPFANSVGIHSNPRLTIDIDFLIGVDEKNLDNVMAALEDFGIKIAANKPKNLMDLIELKRTK